MSGNTSPGPQSSTNPPSPGSVSARTNPPAGKSATPPAASSAAQSTAGPSAQNQPPAESGPRQATAAPAAAAASPAPNTAKVDADLSALILRTTSLAGNRALSEAERNGWHRTTSRLISTQAELPPAVVSATGVAQKPWWSTALIWMGGLAALLALILRTWGVLAGVVYGPDPIRYVEGVLVAGVIMVVAGVIAPRGEAVVENLAQALGLVSGLVAIIALTGIFVPAAPGSTGDPDCAGARTYGAAFVASAAVDGGVNARSEPRRTAPQVARYPPGCLVGFDGFCLGEPVTDSAYVAEEVRRMDARWLRVARHRNPFLHFLAKWISGEPDHDRFIAGGVMVAQSLVDLQSVKFKCQKDDPAIVSFELSIDRMTHDVIGVVKSVNDAQDVQFSVYIAGPTSRGNDYRQIPPANQPTMSWKASVTASSLLEESSIVVISAVPCLSPSIAPFMPDVAKTQVVALGRDGTVTVTNQGPPATFDLNQAAEEACKAVE